MKKLLVVLGVITPLVLIGAATVWLMDGGDSRRVGAISAASEPVGLSWRGAWNPETTYLPGHVVSYEGSSYVAESEVTEAVPNPRRCLRECAWALLSSQTAPQTPLPTSQGGRVVKAVSLSVENTSATLYDIEGVGRVQAFCSPNPPASVSWHYSNTTSESRFAAYQKHFDTVNRYMGVGGAYGPGQGISGGGDAFADRLAIFPLDATTTTPFADVFISGAVRYNTQPPTCQVRAIAVSG